MSDAAPLAWQPSLLAADAEPAIDVGFAALTRVELDETAWVDHATGWVTGSDEVFHRLREGAPWQHHVVPMYGRMVDQPRLTAWWRLESGEPPFLPLIEEMRVALSQRYRVTFDSVGSTSTATGATAWPGTAIASPRTSTTRWSPSCRSASPAGSCSVRAPGKEPGAPPRGGDLLVTGGSSQRTWQHTVPKVAKAGPRISITFRHGA